MIGEYLSPSSLASLCSESKRLRAVFADRFRIGIASLALLGAAQIGDIKTAQQAIKEVTVDVNHFSRECRTPLSFAPERGDVIMTRLLLKAEDIDICREDDLLISPLS